MSVFCRQRQVASFLWGVLAFVSFIVACILAFTKDSISYPVTFLAAALLLIMCANLDRLAEFSGLGVKVALREKIAEADTTLESLRNLAVTLAEQSLATLMAGCFGFEDGMNRLSRFRKKEDIMLYLKRMGVTTQELDEIETRSGWKRGVKMIYWNAISHVLEKRIEPHHVNFAEPERRRLSEEMERTFTRGADDFTEWCVGTAQEIQDAITARGFEIDPILAKWLEDYDVYLSTGVMRRPEKLLKGAYS